jgi:hypothetical protein
MVGSLFVADVAELHEFIPGRPVGVPSPATRVICYYQEIALITSRRDAELQFAEGPWIYT